MHLPARFLVAAFLWNATPRAPAAPFTWTLSEDVATPLFDHADADAGVVREGANFWVQTSLWPDWWRYRGTNLDNLTAQQPAQRDASFDQPHGDDAYWTNGMWKDAAGKIYAIIHIEYDYAKPRRAFLWRRRIGLATSEDQGAHWHYAGDILTTNPARSGAPRRGCVDFGCGDTYLFVDRRNGFFYLFYMTAWIEADSGQRLAQAVNVARSPISAKLAPGSWVKWSGDSWKQPGLGGTESPVFAGADSAVVHFNTYLKAFVAFGRDSSGRAWLTSCSSLATENWQPRDDRFPPRLFWYNWPINPQTLDRYEIGQKFRIYSSQANVDGVGSKYMNVILH